MRSYNDSSLRPLDPASSVWALNWARRFAGDLPNEGGAYPVGSMSDEEWLAWLEGDMLGIYYRPHITAAAQIESNPNWLLRESLMSDSEERRSPLEVAGAIRRAGGWIDNKIKVLDPLLEWPTTGIRVLGF